MLLHLTPTYVTLRSPQDISVLTPNSINFSSDYASTSCPPKYWSSSRNKRRSKATYGFDLPYLPVVHAKPVCPSSFFEAATHRNVSYPVRKSYSMICSFVHTFQRPERMDENWGGGRWGGPLGASASLDLRRKVMMRLGCWCPWGWIYLVPRVAWWSTKLSSAWYGAKK